MKEILQPRKKEPSETTSLGLRWDLCHIGSHYTFDENAAQFYAWTPVQYVHMTGLRRPDVISLVIPIYDRYHRPTCRFPAKIPVADREHAATIKIHNKSWRRTVN